MILVNTKTRKIINDAGVAIRFEHKPSIFFNSAGVLSLQLLKDNAPFVINPTDTFEMAMDINYIHTDELCVYSQDFTIVDAEQGLIDIAFSTNTIAFGDKIRTPDRRLIMEVKRYIAGDTIGEVLVQDELRGQPSVIDTESPPEVVSPEYFTAVETTALVQSIPKGDKGDKGDQGEQGPQGPQGDKGDKGDMLIQNYAPTAATIELNPDTNIYTITINSATTFVFDTTALNLVAGQACTFELDLTMSTVSTLTFPASVSWVYGTPYMSDADKIYRLVFHSMDQGLSWHANLAFERSIA